MDSVFSQTRRIRRKPLAVATAAFLVLFGLVHLYATIAPPHTATVVLEFEEDDSTRVFTTGPVLSPAWVTVPASSMFAAEVSNRLLTLDNSMTRLAPNVISQKTTIQIDRKANRAVLGFEDDRRDVAEQVIAVMVPVLEEMLATIGRVDPSRSRWDLVAVGSVEKSGIDPSVVGGYLLASALLLAAIPRRWWVEPMERDKRDRAIWWLIGIGLAGLVLSVTADTLGFGWPGFGTVKVLLAVASAMVLARGLFVVDDEVDVPFWAPAALETRWSLPASIPVPRWWPSRRVAVIGTAGLLVVVGLTSWMVALTRGTYRATAELTVGFEAADLGTVIPPDGRAFPDLSREKEILESQELAGMVVALADRIEQRRFAWYDGEPCGAACEFDAASFQSGLDVEVDDGTPRLFVHFSARYPERARIGANLAVEAYSILLAQDPNRFDTPVRCGLSLPLRCPPENRLMISSKSYALTATTNIPDGGEMTDFVGAFVLVVVAIWALWPDPARDTQSGAHRRTAD